MVGLYHLFGDDATVLREKNFQILLLSAVFPIAGTALLSPVLDSLIGPFGTSPANIGLMISLYTAPGIVMMPIAGAIVDRYGRKPVLVTALLVFALSGVAIVATTDFRVVLALRLIQGIGAGGINPILVTIIGDMYTGATEATGQGIRVTVAGVGAAVFPLVAGLVVVIAWQYPFLLYAFALPVAIAVLLWFDESTPPDGSCQVGSRNTRSYIRAMLQLVSHRRVALFLIARSLPTSLWFGFLTYNSIIVIRLMDGTPPQAGLLAAIAGILLAFSASQAGRIVNRFNSIFVPLVASNVFFGVGFIGMLVSPGIVIATIGIAIMGIGFGFLMSLYRSILTGLPPDVLRGGLVGLGEAGDRLAATLAPVAIGFSILILTPQVGFTLALQLACGGMAVVASGGGILCLFAAQASPGVPGGGPGNFDR